MDRYLTRTAVRRAAVAFAPAVLLVVLAGLLATGYWQTRRTRAEVARSREAALSAERVFSHLKDAESGNRGYVLIGEERYLAPYHAALGRLSADTTVLRTLSSRDRAQVQRLDSLATLIAARLELLARGVELRRSGDATAATDLVRSGTGVAHMEQIRSVMRDVIAHERAHITASFAAEERASRTLIGLFALGISALLVLGWVVNRSLLRFATDRAAAAATISAQHERLQEQATELELQRDQLQEQNTELETQQDQLQRQSLELELQQEELQESTAGLVELNAELRHANAALDAARMTAEQANRAKSQFLAAMSHELRTPLNAIAGYVDLVDAGVYGELTQGQRDAMARVRANQQHLLSVISDILSYAGTAAGSLAVRTEDVPLQPLLVDIEQIIHPVARQRELTLIIEEPQPGDGAVVRADPARMRQILINLLANAIKFTPRGGCITVMCRQTEHAVELDVQDTGPGIRADKLEAIFEPFVQLDRSNHEQGGRGGLGLGLALSRELARGMNGDVTVRSTVGAGSVFTLRVPRAVPRESTMHAIPELPAHPQR